MDDIYSKEVITLEEAKRRDDYVFSAAELEPIVPELRKNWLESFSENGDPLRGCAVLEIGFIDVEVNIYSKEQEGKSGDKTPDIGYFCCIRTSNDDASWVSDDYIDYKPSVDWNSDDWKEQLEQDMFKALSMYAKKRCYNFNKPNSLKPVSINSPKSVFITRNE